MSKYISGNQKHLTLNDRIYIENELAKGTPFKDIAAFLCKDPTTISKEIRTHRLSDWYHKGTFYNAKNFGLVPTRLISPPDVKVETTFFQRNFFITEPCTYPRKIAQKKNLRFLRSPYFTPFL